jgi:hypothetical protein
MYQCIFVHVHRYCTHHHHVLKLLKAQSLLTKRIMSSASLVALNAEWKTQESASKATCGIKAKHLLNTRVKKSASKMWSHMCG